MAWKTVCVVADHRADGIAVVAGLWVVPTMCSYYVNPAYFRAHYVIPIHIRGIQIEYVTDYIYLGQTLSFQNSAEKEMKRLIAQAWKKFWSLKHILTDKYHRTILKAGILEACVIPVLTYGCQTWSLPHRLKQMIQVCQQKMERKITDVTLEDRVRCEDLRRTTGMRDASNQTERLQWK